MFRSYEDELNRLASMPNAQITRKELADLSSHVLKITEALTKSVNVSKDDFAKQKAIFNMLVDRYKSLPPLSSESINTDGEFSHYLNKVYDAINSDEDRQIENNFNDIKINLEAVKNIINESANEVKSIENESKHESKIESKKYVMQAEIINKYIADFDRDIQKMKAKQEESILKLTVLMQPYVEHVQARLENSKLSLKEKAIFDAIIYKNFSVYKTECKDKFNEFIANFETLRDKLKNCQSHSVQSEFLNKFVETHPNGTISDEELELLKIVYLQETLKKVIYDANELVSSYKDKENDIELLITAKLINKGKLAKEALNSLIKFHNDMDEAAVKLVNTLRTILVQSPFYWKRQAGKMGGTETKMSFANGKEFVEIDVKVPNHVAEIKSKSLISKDENNLNSFSILANIYNTHKNSPASGNGTNQTQEFYQLLNELGPWLNKRNQTESLWFITQARDLVTDNELSSLYELQLKLDKQNKINATIDSLKVAFSSYYNKNIRYFVSQSQERFKNNLSKVNQVQIKNAKQENVETNNNAHSDEDDTNLLSQSSGDIFSMSSADLAEQVRKISYMTGNTNNNSAPNTQVSRIGFLAAPRQSTQVAPELGQTPLDQMHIEGNVHGKLSRIEKEIQIIETYVPTPSKP